MKKIISTILLILLCLFIFPSKIKAFTISFEPSSRLYFLQSTIESIRLFFTFSNEEKLHYLLELSDRRLDEVNKETLSLSSQDTKKIMNRYENNVREMNRLANQVKNKEGAMGQIKVKNIEQQQILSTIYTQAPSQVRETIVNTQNNTARNVKDTIEKIEGPQKAIEYINMVSQIQAVQQLQQQEQMGVAPMEASPASDPSKNTPQQLKYTNPIMPGQELKEGLEPQPIKSSGSQDTGQMQKAEPVQMNAPAGQN